MSYWILYRSLTMGETVLFETDGLSAAMFLLQSIVETPSCQLIDFSGTLDGVLDHTLEGVKLFPVPEAV
jgi:hypothetical protein